MADSTSPDVVSYNSPQFILRNGYNFVLDILFEFLKGIRVIRVNFTFQCKSLSRSGRSKLWDIENNLRGLEENLQTALVGWQKNFSALKDTIYRQIKTLGIQTEAVDPVPQELTSPHAQSRVDICRQFISNPINDRIIRRIMCDEQWVYYLNPDASKQWLDLRQPAKIAVKEIGSAPK